MFNIYDQKSCFVGGTPRRAHCELLRGAEQQPISKQADWRLKRDTEMVMLNLSACRLPYLFPLKSRFNVAGFWILCVWSLTFSSFVKKTYSFVSVHFHIEERKNLPPGSALDFWPPIVCETSQNESKTSRDVCSYIIQSDWRWRREKTEVTVSSTILLHPASQARRGRGGKKAEKPDECLRSVGWYASLRRLSSFFFCTRGNLRLCQRRRRRRSRRRRRKTDVAHCHA